MTDKMTTTDGATVTYVDRALNAKTLLVTGRKSVAISLTEMDRRELIIMLGGRPMTDDDPRVRRARYLADRMPLAADAEIVRDLLAVVDELRKHCA